MEVRADLENQDLRRAAAAALPDFIQNIRLYHFQSSAMLKVAKAACFSGVSTLALQNGIDMKTISSMQSHYDAGFTLQRALYRIKQSVAHVVGLP